MKKSLQLIISGAFFITNMGYAQWTKIKGNGKVITENRSTVGYDEVNVSGFFDVVLVSGKEGAITIKGEENLLPYVKVEVKDNVLHIYTEKNINISTKENLILTVPFEEISAVSLSGSGDVSSKNTIVATTFKTKLSGSGDLTLDVKATDFEANLSGSGDVVLTGNSDTFTSKISGSGDVDAVNLITKKANVTISGSGDMKVNCSDSLYARVSGSGDIAYKGNPESKDTKVNGSGEISKI
ncbi:head GIN domain-containing protein [Flavobacterium sp. 5]|uniref:head GIN domain-containing protein n=1 Tax=Flavobacterium sp. 5 TaxID=2035199 RepID=UPI000C2C6544|nr:head GIN domain-containing protein [Flavobacterium sp. 5]PKB18695.1 putative autotransporter adhesin-like protein [Flavobacterium sp. 5]